MNIKLSRVVSLKLIRTLSELQSSQCNVVNKFSLDLDRLSKA